MGGKVGWWEMTTQQVNLGRRAGTVKRAMAKAIMVGRAVVVAAVVLAVLAGVVTVAAGVATVAAAVEAITTTPSRHADAAHGQLIATAGSLLGVL